MISHRLSSVETNLLGKQYNHRFVLKDVSLLCKRGDLAILSGENGAGKSTLLHLLALTLAEDHGYILYDGLKKNQLEPSLLRSTIGFLSHQASFYPMLTAFENLTFFAQLYGKSPADSKELATLWLSHFGLSQVEHRRVQTFSAGMFKRLSLAKTFLHSPSLFLLDEPFTALDEEGKENLITHLVQAKKDGCIILIATHEFAELSPLCTKLIVLSKGRLKATHDFENQTTYDSLLSLYRGAR